MKTKLNIFILKDAVRVDLVDSFSHNDCNVSIFSTLEEMLSSSVATPKLIILDEPFSELDKRRTGIKIDQNFPTAEVIYLSREAFLSSKSVEQNGDNQKSTVAIDQMLYYIAYQEHFDTDNLVIDSVDNKIQNLFIPLAISMLATVLVGALYFA